MEMKSERTANASEMMWVDVSWYGMRWFAMPTGGKHFVVAAGAVATHDAALRELGFRRHAWQGVYMREGMPRGVDLKRVLPRLEFVQVANPADVVLSAATVQTQPRDESIEAVTPARQQSGAGRGLAVLFAEWDILRQWRSAPHDAIRIHVGDLVVGIRGALTRDGAGARFTIVGTDGGTVRTLLAAGQFHVTDADGSDDAAATVARWHAAWVHHGRVVPDAPIESAKADVIVADPAVEHGDDGAGMAGAENGGSDDDDGKRARTTTGSGNGPVSGNEEGDRGRARSGDELSRSREAGQSGDGDGARVRRRRVGVRADDDQATLFGDVRGGVNFRLLDTSIVDHGSFRAADVAARNIEAIRILRTLDEEKRDPTSEEQTALIQYAGWGGLPQAFEADGALASFGETLHSLVGESGYEAARASTLNAHYTAVPIIDAIWSAVTRTGFTGGRVLEPGAGSGLFMARVPEEAASKTAFVAVEKDATTARLLKALYPAAKVYGTAYEETPIPDASMDLVIGNVPFADVRIHDSRYRSTKPVLHDYCILKSLDKLRDGGVMAVITSTGTLDKGDPRVRRAMYEGGADLLAACRLPEDAFSANANTHVTTDILFFRKRKAGDIPGDADWIGLTEIEGRDGQTMELNAIFATDRGHMLGYPVLSGRMYGGARPALVRKDPRHSEAEWTTDRILEQVRQAVPENVWDPVVRQQSTVASPEILGAPSRDVGTNDEGNYVLHNGVVGQIFDGVVAKATFRVASDEARVRAWIPVRDAIRDCLRLQLQATFDEAAFETALATLNAAYDKAVAGFGPVSSRANRRAMAEDPDLALLLAAEEFDEETGVARKADVFRGRTIGAPDRPPESASVADALTWCMNRHGSVVPSVIESIAGRPWDECADELIEQSLIFRNPENGDFELAVQYLSGDVRSKLEVAVKAAEANPAFAANVEALKARMPSDLVAEEIDVALGQPWIPEEHIAAFVARLYETDEARVRVTHNAATADWGVVAPSIPVPKWSTNRFTAAALVELALRGQLPKAYDKDLDGNLVLNPQETAIAIERQSAIKREFQNWIWTGEERKQTLVGIYNRLFRSWRSPDYGTIAMTVPGMSATRALRPHQSSAVSRVVMEQSTLLSHPVGFGKTATMVSAAMKLRSLGFARKSAIVVRKNTLYQCAAEAQRWFPQARVLLIRSEDLNPKGRERFWRQVQTRNADIILVTPEAFKRLRLPLEAERDYVHDEIAQIEHALKDDSIESSTRRGRARSTTKRLEKRRAQAQEKLKALLNISEKDDKRITLGDLGIDALFVDEAQNYKNLAIDSREQLLGIPTAAAQKASDMHSKVQYLLKEGKRVVFATGTPIVNTLAEAFNLQRYLSADVLDKLSIHSFDAWMAQFGEPISSLEPDPGSGGYRLVRRLAEVRNVPELVSLLSTFTDSVSETSVDLGRPNAAFETVAVDATPLQQAYRELLAARVREIRGKARSREDKDNVLAVLGDARRAAMDLRTMYPGLLDEDGGNKLSTVVAKIAHEYNESAAMKGTQVVFADFSTPGAGWNAYRAIREGLIARGIPEREVAFIHECGTDAAKAALFTKVRSGEVRVLIGSTEKMGEGTNVQDRLVALHHLNAPYHPGAVTQRNGRIIRQGNQNKDVRIYTYVTKGLLEDWNWHLVLLKQRFIGQIMEGIAAHTDGDGLARRMVEDPASSMSFEEIEGMASGDPMVKEKCRIDAEVKRLRLMRDAHGSQQAELRYSIRRDNDLIEDVDRRLEYAQQLVAALQPAVAGELPVRVEDRAFSGDGAVTKAGEAILALVKRSSPYRSEQVATVRGLKVLLAPSASGPRLEIVPPDAYRGDGFNVVAITDNPVALVKRIERAVEEIEQWPTNLKNRRAELVERVQRNERETGQEWPEEGRYQEALAEQARIDAEIQAKSSGIEMTSLGETSIAFEGQLTAARTRFADEYGIAELATQQESAVADNDDWTAVADDVDLDDDESDTRPRKAATMGM